MGLLDDLRLTECMIIFAKQHHKTQSPQTSPTEFVSFFVARGYPTRNSSEHVKIRIEFEFSVVSQSGEAWDEEQTKVVSRGLTCARAALAF